MNERIEKLISRSFTDEQGEQFNIEKFTKLIVNECVSKYDEYAEHSIDKTSFGLARHNVKKYFGVE
jgi:CRISPR/Cas system endoribonuclease Cas6 (RAMP superfamily)